MEAFIGLTGEILIGCIEKGELSTIDYNLSTGKRIEREGTIGSDVHTTVLDKIIKLNTLPTLDEFEPYAEGLY